jgi:hypothetical protein
VRDQALHLYKTNGKFMFFFFFLYFNLKFLDIRREVIRFWN